MRPPRVKFDAPRDFDDKVYEAYGKHFDMNSVKPDVWVCDPNANFVIGSRELSKYPTVKILATPSTGTNHIDVDECKRRKVKVISLLDDRNGLNTISASAEFTFKLLLDCMRMEPAHELQGKLVGMIGLGRIGSKMAGWCLSFGAKVEANDPHIKDFSSYPLKKLFKDCDAVVVCCTLNDETKGLVTKELIASMKPGACLVNTSRGEVLDEEGLVEVMQERPDLRVAVDVLQGMTSDTEEPLRLERLGAIVTPHIAGKTFESRTKAAQIILGLLEKELIHE